jgi:hypothetical protein
VELGGDVAACAQCTVGAESASAAPASSPSLLVFCEVCGFAGDRLRCDLRRGTLALFSLRVGGREAARRWTRIHSPRREEFLLFSPPKPKKQQSGKAKGSCGAHCITPLAAWHGRSCCRFQSYQCCDIAGKYRRIRSIPCRPIKRRRRHPPGKPWPVMSPSSYGLGGGVARREEAGPHRAGPVSA